MSVVIDTSVTMTWCFEDEATPSTEDILDLVVAEGALASPLWTLEVTNVLISAERRGRLTEAQSARFVNLLMQLPITIAPDCPTPAVVLGLARTHGLTTYDASNLWLAEARGLPLATLDVRLRRAAGTAGVSVLPG